MRNALSVFSVLVFGITMTTFCHAMVNDWEVFIDNVKKADVRTIQSLPRIVAKTGDSIDDDKADQLSVALSFALIRDPITVLKSTDEVEKSTDPQQNRFGSLLICSIPMMGNYTKKSTEQYFSQAVSTLNKTGENAKECLNHINETMDQIRMEEKQGSVHWGDKVFTS